MPNEVEPTDEEQVSTIGPIVSVLALVTLGICYAGGWEVGFLVSSVVVISILIWQACDPFADAAQWIGQRFELPGSVRGATLDAVASSMPELFSGLFFVIVALTSVDPGDPKALEAAGAEGYASTIATCAGSAVYNMILIPAFCALVISFYRQSRPTIDIDDEVITRDGVWFVGCNLVLVVFLFQDAVTWWMAVVLLGLYAVYVYHLFHDAQVYRVKVRAIQRHLEKVGEDATDVTVIEAVKAEGYRVSRVTAIRSIDAHAEGELGIEEEEQTRTAGVFFGMFDVPLNGRSAWAIIVCSTLVSALACYFLVESTYQAAEVLSVPAFFVAVIIAAAASSVPDTLLAIGAAMRGDDSGAVSNAFGSNIFDICVCLSIPLLVNSYLLGWEPVSLLQDGHPASGLVGLRVLLVVLTISTLGIMWHKRQLTRTKALVLCGSYVLFIAYAVLGSLGLLDF
ncbi:sodium:calcium antiporter [Thalassoroseus pseudoceratinae]|uniref:sodium:calcium antiporter n=1 Tax=Thalassoroseus pseudoceratinae TaxID=2713176 RepID=UPI00142192FA|nr:hypothetical protein [Thalassoroseus pseudoceratinae]